MIPPSVSREGWRWRKTRVHHFRKEWKGKLCGKERAKDNVKKDKIKKGGKKERGIFDIIL